MQNIPKELLPKQELYLSPNFYFPKNYPFIVKPDWGERGTKVELIKNYEDWCTYKKNFHHSIIIQEYISLPKEYGLFYYRYPHSSNGNILGITSKQFLEVVGDGVKTLTELILENFRAKKRRKYLMAKFRSQQQKVLKKGEVFLLEEIGNHNRGTQFYDASHLITPQLILSLDLVAKNIPEFYYGRFDIKTNSEEELKNGKFVILEVNGTNSEATHIYDQKYNLFEAYRIVFHQLTIQEEISRINAERKIPKQSFLTFIKDITIKYVSSTS